MAEIAGAHRPSPAELARVSKVASVVSTVSGLILTFKAPSGLVLVREGDNGGAKPLDDGGWPAPGGPLRSGRSLGTAIGGGAAGSTSARGWRP